MKSLRAISAGFIFIIVSFFILQLVYMVAATFYNDLSKDYPYLIEISLLLKTLVVIPSFLAIMFLGGYLTGVINHRKVLLHSFIVGLLASGAMMWAALNGSDFSTRGLLINGAMLIATIAGGYFRKRKLRSYDDYVVG
jgi:hypothetical protein